MSIIYIRKVIAKDLINWAAFLDKVQDEIWMFIAWKLLLPETVL